MNRAQVPELCYLPVAGALTRWQVQDPALAKVALSLYPSHNSARHRASRERVKRRPKGERRRRLLEVLDEHQSFVLATELCRRMQPTLATNVHFLLRELLAEGLVECSGEVRQLRYRLLRPTGSPRAPRRAPRRS